MATAKSGKSKLTRIYNRLGRLYGKRRRTGYGTTLEQLILAVLTSEAKEAEGMKALAMLQEEYVDWNEVRISPGETLREELTGVGVNSRAPDLLKHTLEGLLHETSSLEPDVLDDFSPQQFIAILNRIKFPKALTASLLLARDGLPRGFKVPIDSGIARVMSRVGFIKTPRATNQIQECIETMLPGREQGNFHRTVGMLSRKHCTNDAPDCAKCPLKRDCSFHSSRQHELAAASGRRSAGAARRVSADRRSRPPSRRCSRA